LIICATAKAAIASVLRGGGHWLLLLLLLRHSIISSISQLTSSACICQQLFCSSSSCFRLANVMTKSDNKQEVLLLCKSDYLIAHLSFLLQEYCTIV
jgi:hypothetical protein